MRKKIASERIKKRIRLFLIILLPLIILFAGLFLFSARDKTPPEPPDNTSPVETTQAPAPDEPWVNPVKYIHRSEIINGLKQEINIMEINMDSSGVRICLSYPMI